MRRDISDPGPQLIAGFRTAIDADYAENVARMLATRPPGPFWLFGISSLIWRPETAFTERRVATAQGWHRRFCLGWDYRFRGTRDQPGLMALLAADGPTAFLPKPCLPGDVLQRVRALLGAGR